MNDVAEKIREEVTTKYAGARTTSANVKHMIRQSNAMIKTLSSSLSIDDDNEYRKTPKRYSITVAAKLVGMSSQAIRGREVAGTFPPPELDANGKRLGFTLKDINRMRADFGIRVGRSDIEKAVAMAFQNFKGGVGKTTLTCHFAQFLAEKGYRVLLIDADSQASSTMMFGWRPDTDITAAETLYPYFCGEHADLNYAIRKTHWDQLDLIPACLELYSSEYHLASIASNSESAGWMDMLSIGVSTIADKYDVILIDAPPALGMVSINVLRALTGLIIPAPAAMTDFHSTSTFLRMLDEVLDNISSTTGVEVDYDFIKVLVSKFDKNKPAQDFVAQLTSTQFGQQVLDNWFVHSAEIDNASSLWQTVYELEKASGSPRTYKRCVDSMNAVFNEIENDIKRTWPSNNAALHDQAVLVGA